MDQTAPGDQGSPQAYSFLALGDSYTIGEGVEAAESFPFQTATILRAAGVAFLDPVILARTGWTTGELIKGLGSATPGSSTPRSSTPGSANSRTSREPAAQSAQAAPLPALTPPYDFVSLLIGVNNEYRGLSETEYAREFRSLLESAISLAGDRPQRTFVLSIPDWSVSPFAAIHLPDELGRDPQDISREIDQFNQLAAHHAEASGVEFIDITGHTRKAESSRSSDERRAASKSTGSGSGGKQAGSGSDNSWFASDGLHPSGREYRHWAEELALWIKARLAEEAQ